MNSKWMSLLLYFTVIVFVAATSYAFGALYSSSKPRQHEIISAEGRKFLVVKSYRGGVSVTPLEP